MYLHDVGKTPYRSWSHARCQELCDPIQVPFTEGPFRGVEFRHQISTAIHLTTVDAHGMDAFDRILRSNCGEYHNQETVNLEIPPGSHPRHPPDVRSRIAIHHARAPQRGIAAIVRCRDWDGGIITSVPSQLTRLLISLPLINRLQRGTFGKESPIFQLDKDATRERPPTSFDSAKNLDTTIGSCNLFRRKAEWSW